MTPKMKVTIKKLGNSKYEDMTKNEENHKNEDNPKKEDHKN